MLRYDRQTKPGLVALYNIRPGNGAGPFLQPRSLHGASAQQCSNAVPMQKNSNKRQTRQTNQIDSISLVIPKPQNPLHHITIQNTRTIQRTQPSATAAVIIT